MERYAARIDPCWDAAAWRTQARHALRAGIAPEHIDWLETQLSVIDRIGEPNYLLTKLDD